MRGTHGRPYRRPARSTAIRRRAETSAPARADAAVSTLPAGDGPLGHVAGRARRRRPAPRRPSGSTSTTTAGSRSPSPATGARRRPSPTATGRCIYRTRFELDAGPGGARHWVVLDGVFYQADVWLDGAYLGDPEGYFFPHAYEITDLARLGARARARRRGDLRAAAGPAGQAQPHRRLPALGLHRPGVEPRRPVAAACGSSGRARCGSTACGCCAARPTPSGPTCMVRAELDSDEARTVRVRTTVDDRVERELEQSAGRGDQRGRVDLRRRQPPPVVAVGARRPAAVHPRRSRSSSTTSRATPAPSAPGCGRWRCTDWVLSVNGERLFLKGVNLGPTRLALGEATPEELRRDVVLAAEAGLDLLRVHAHITRPELYDAADELGMLIWQDLPLQWGYARSVGKQAARQAAEAVDLLGHHPSIAIWCGHNEPLDPRRRARASPSTCARTAIELRRRARSCRRWNRVDPRPPGSSARSSGPTAPARSSPTPASLPHLPQLDGTDSHLYFGWYHGEERDLPAFAAAVAPHGALRQRVRRAGRAGRRRRSWSPSAGRTSTGSGCRSTTRSRRRSFDERVPPADHATFAGWRQATQRYQARRPAPPHRDAAPAEVPARPAASASSAWPTPIPAVTWSRARPRPARPSWRTTSSPRRAGR